MVNKVQESVRYWAKFIVDNWKALAAILALVIGNGWQFTDREEKSLENTAMADKITELTQVMSGISTQTVIQKTECKHCLTKQDLINHERKFHGE